MIVIEDGRKSFTQWDKGIYVLIDEGCDSIDVSRSDKKVSRNVKVQKAGSVFRAAVPDALLTEAGYLNISCIAEEKDGNRTISTYRFRITPRAKPENYAFGHEELGSWKSLLLRMNALERAAREGQFDGSPGVGVQAVEPYITAEMSGFENVYHVILTNGQIFELRIHNGRDGKAGADGKPGADGNGISRIEPVSQSTESGGQSIYRIFYSDGSTFDYTIYNGKDGVKGASIASVTIEKIEEQAEADPFVTKSYVMRIIESDESTVRYNAQQEKTEGERLVAQYNIGLLNAVSGILKKQEYDDPCGIYVSGMTVYLKNGKAIVSGKLHEVKQTSGITISTKEYEQRRSYFIRFDRTNGKTMMYSKLMQTGTDDLITSSEGETLPVRNESYYDIVIGYIDIPANTTELTADMIHDLRGDPKYCGYVEYVIGGGSGGSGDMQKSVYDPNGNEKDIFKYADDISKLAVTNHALSDTAHTDIRELITGLTNRLNVLADSDDETLDQLSEIVAYIKSNKSLIDAITTGKVSVSDIVDNLTSSATNKPLSAAQGKALKTLIDAIVIPEKLPNPNALTFTGAVTGSYDGSAAFTVNVPSGGSGTDVSLGVTGATVGQIAKITAVDDTGKPTAWEAMYVESGLEKEWRLLDSIDFSVEKNQIQTFEWTDLGGVSDILIFVNGAQNAETVDSGYNLIINDKSIANLFASNKKQGSVYNWWAKASFDGNVWYAKKSGGTTNYNYLNMANQIEEPYALIKDVGTAEKIKLEASLPKYKNIAGNWEIWVR